jgi:hypothetical protein
MSTKIFISRQTSSNYDRPLADYLELIESYSQQKITTIDTLHYYLLKITQIYSQRQRNKLLSQDLSELFLKWFHDFLSQNFFSGLQYLLRYLLDLFVSDDKDDRAPYRSPRDVTAVDPFWKYFLDPSLSSSSSFLSLLLKAHTIYQHDIAIPKLISYLLKYFVERDSERPFLLEGIDSYDSNRQDTNQEERLNQDNGQLQRQGLGQESPQERTKQWSQFLEEVILILMKKECSLSMMFNYARCLHWLPESKRRNEKLIVSGLNRILSSIYSMQAPVACFRIPSIQCSELESYLILSALSLFHTWPSLTHDDNKCQERIHFEILCDQLMIGLHSYYRNARLCLLVCLSIKSALEKEREASPSLICPPHPHPRPSLSEHCLSRWNLLEQLVTVIRHHANKYRIVVAALECFYLLTQPSLTSSPFQILTPTSPPPSTEDDHHSSPSTSISSSSISTSSSSASSSSPSLFPAIFPSTDDRVSTLLSLWNPFLTSQYFHQKWNQRKSFCLFLVCCCRSSCVYGNWSVHNEMKQLIFPSLDLIFSSIIPMKSNKSSHHIAPSASLKRSENVKLVEKIFFSKSLCVRISSYL